ncbi:MAG: 2-C-methyl-D-erythritol 2,4-cyclodiphosphate synthase [Candidatus Izemoplasma sp.]
MIRIGHSYDLHRLVKNRKLIIGGIEIPSELGALGHSDADVLLHTVAESLLGALALGDLGKLFPDTSDEFKDIDSALLVKHVLQLVVDKGYRIINIDSTIHLETPKLRNYIDSIRQNIANILGIDVSFISVKATTSEKLGIIGKSEAIAAETVVLLEQKNKIRML